MSDIRQITFSPPVPCATIDGISRCGKPATVATIYPMGGGQWIMQPFCKDCVAALVRVYNLLPPEEREEPNP